MKKFIIISLLVLLANTFAMAQITSYSSYDNVEKVVFEVEDMSSNEIKIYNEAVNAGEKTNNAIALINVGRSQKNLINAPATIIEFHFASDEVPGAEGSVGLLIELMNTTPKTIREITLEFEFENDNSPIYDIKTGDKYLVLKFENLSGRSNSERYGEISEGLMKSYHLLAYENATYKKLFYNKKASKVMLHSVNIKYDDGTTTAKAAIFSNGILGDKRLLPDGPLSPIIRYLEYLREDKSKEVKKEETSQTPQQNDEVFLSAAHMPRYPGGDAALMKYLNDHMVYPDQAKLDNIQGKVIVQFVVQKDGSVGEAKISRSVDKELDQEALRLVKSLPSFSPGRNAVGDPVDVWYTLPVTFKLP